MNFNDRKLNSFTKLFSINVLIGKLNFFIWFENYFIFYLKMGKLKINYLENQLHLRVLSIQYSIVFKKFVWINSSYFFIIREFHLNFQSHGSKFFDPTSDLWGWDFTCNHGLILLIDCTTFMKDILKSDIDHLFFTCKREFHHGF